MASERERIVARIAELEAALRIARSDDLRATIQAAIADCERTLVALNRSGGELAPRSG